MMSADLKYVEQGNGVGGSRHRLNQTQKTGTPLNPLIPWNTEDKFHVLIPRLGQTSLIHPSALSSHIHLCVHLP